MERRSVVNSPRLDRVFVDASFLIAVVNRRDQFHKLALQHDVALQRANDVLTTDAALLELTATLAAPPFREVVADFWDQFHGGDRRFRSVEATAENLANAMSLYRSRPDKSWSLTDCCRSS